MLRNTLLIALAFSVHADTSQARAQESPLPQPAAVAPRAAVSVEGRTSSVIGSQWTGPQDVFAALRRSPALSQLAALSLSAMVVGLIALIFRRRPEREVLIAGTLPHSAKAGSNRTPSSTRQTPVFLHHLPHD